MSGLRRVFTVLGMTALAACAGVMRTTTSAPAPTTAGTVDTFRVAMPQLGGRERTVRVYTPPGYAAGRARYPVLYLQDAQSVFTPGLYGDWRVDETLDSLVAAGRMRGLIVVGIDNGERRWDEYGPWTNHRMFDWVESSWSREVEGGEGAAYVDFLASTLKLEIDRRYRTLADRAHTAIGGASMGGVISLYAGLTRPDVFSRVMAMSTAVWFAEGGGSWLAENRLIDFIRSRPAPRDVRFWLDVGSDERSRATDPDVVDAQGRRVTYPRAYVEGSEAAAAALAAAGVPAANLRHLVDAGAVHNEGAWASRFADAVLWLFR
jgi:predicted alpha/beta superfamily hydrolase